MRRAATLSPTSWAPPRELRRLHGLRSDLPPELLRTPEDDLVHVPCFYEALEMLEVRPLAAPAPGRQGLGRHQELVTDRQAHAHLAQINRQNPRHATRPRNGYSSRNRPVQMDPPCRHNRAILQQKRPGCHITVRAFLQETRGGIRAATAAQHLS